MSEPEYRSWWLQVHAPHADEIVVDAVSGRLLKAVYSTVRGVPRRWPIEYPYEPETSAYPLDNARALTGDHQTAGGET